MKSIFNFLFPNKYEGALVLRNYIRSQYGPFFLEAPYYHSETFYQTIISESLPYIRTGSSTCDIGCALGRLTFEWARTAKHSIGIDSSKQFIEFCTTIGQNKTLRFEPALTCHPEFVCADALTYPFKEKTFDFISCINVIDRVTDPQLLIDVLYNALTPGGTLVLSDPYDWELSPAPAKRRLHNMQQLLTREHWALRKELRVYYTIPIDDVRDRTYRCHTLIATKIRQSELF
jgi:SAM-dependent methyltransferase